MQKSNRLTSVIAAVGMLGAVDIILLIILAYSNVFLALENKDVVEKVRLGVPALDAESFIIVGAIGGTILSFIITYNILHVIFQLFFDVLSWQELVFIYSFSALVVTIFGNMFFPLLGMSNDLRGPILNMFYGGGLLMLTNWFIWQYRTSSNQLWLTVLKLNTAILLYAVVNALLTSTGPNIDV